jgi:hypothetical protein
LMGGGGGSFAAMIAARDSRRPSKWAVAQEEKKAVMYVLHPFSSLPSSPPSPPSPLTHASSHRSDKVKEYRSKEDTTMAMFKQLAAARFGSSNP